MCINKQGSDIKDVVYAALDSYGGIRFVSFKNEYQSSAPGYAMRLGSPRTATAQIPASAACGKLGGLNLCNTEVNSTYLLALFSQHDVRLFTTKIREFNSKTISAQMMLIRKV
jgi:hypothetical protein